MSIDQSAIIASINEAHANLRQKIRDARRLIGLKPGQKNRFLDHTTLVDGPVVPIERDQAYKLLNARVFLNRGDLMRHCKELIGIVNSTLEVGTQTGAHSAFMNELFEPDEHFAIDLNLNNFQEQFKSENMVFLEGSSDEIIEKLPNGTIDFCYIDGGHGFSIVQKDIQAVIPKLKSGAIIQFNDYVSFSQIELIPYGVRAAVNEFINEYEVEILGITVAPMGYDDIAIRLKMP